MLCIIKKGMSLIVVMSMILMGTVIAFSTENVLPSEYIIEHDYSTVDLPEFTKSGFTASSVAGYPDGIATGSLSSGAANNWAKWTPSSGALAQGMYKVYIWKVVRSDAIGGKDTNVQIEIVHNVNSVLQTQNYSIDQTGTAGWVEMGTFQFSGTGDEYVKLTRTTATGQKDADNKVIYTHVDSVKFERVIDNSSTYLTSIHLNIGSLNPGFNKDVASYTVSVPTNQITLTPTAETPSTILTVNGQGVASGSPIRIDLLSGNNTITIHVISVDNTQTRDYVLIVNSQTTDNSSYLKNLQMNNGVLNPLFDQNITNYTATVQTVQVILIPTSEDVGAEITINEQAASSGVPFTLNLSEGNNSILIVVTSADRTQTKTYSLMIERQTYIEGNEIILQHDKSSHDVPEYTETGGFADSGIPGYNGIDAVPGSRYTGASGASATWTPIAGALQQGIYNVYIYNVVRSDTIGGCDTNVKVETVHNGKTEVETISQTGTAGWIKLGTYDFAGTGNEFVKLTRITATGARDSNNVVIYTHADSVKFVRVINVNSTLLENIQVSRGILNPGFNIDTTDYSMVVDVDHFAITPVAEYPNAAITINGEVVNSSVPKNVYLKAGNNIINIHILSLDGTQSKTYKLTVNRKVPISNFTSDDGSVLTNLTSGAVNCDVEVKHYSSSVPTALIMCLYKDDQLYDISMDEPENVPEGGTVRLFTRVLLADTDVRSYKVQAYVWNSFAGMKSVGDMKELLP